MLLDTFLNLLLTLSILILIGAVAITSVIIVTLLALFIKSGVEVLKATKDENHD